MAPKEITNVIHPLFKKIWVEESIPSDWSKGLIIKLAKKGDKKDCNNWRGITLLPTISKIFTSVILKRIQDNLDQQLRKEQAGFRKGKSCKDQIFVLRNIVEQSLEWQTPIYINFIDFEKAFDSVHRNSLWSLLRIYGIPSKIVDIIRILHDGFQCSVVHESTTTDWFGVTSGLRQGCLLSPLLFLVAIDWVMRQTTTDNSGIRWTINTKLGP